MVPLAHGSESHGVKGRRTAPLSKRSAPEGENMSAWLTVWCGREDSNFHGLSPTTTSTLRVYQFRHDRIIEKGAGKAAPHGVGARP